ncbi:MAG TPA: PTS sugar transporter subunit IIA [candidate division Zixibacteria bacterium]|nr:PTS sugar transporter subunit IIA [candidate division Zixibacteria bacterium]
MELYKVIQKELCVVDLHSRKKKPAIEELASILKRHPSTTEISEEIIAKTLLAREELGSTGFGGGIAIPHCKIPGMDKFAVCIAISKRGVKFDAIDGRKVHIFCCIIGPENEPEMHVKLLAEISLVLREESVRRALVSAKTPIALYEEFLRHAAPEEAHPQTAKQKLLMMVVQNEEHLIEITELLVEMGIIGATFSSSEGMSDVLTRVPLFADFIDFLGRKSQFHRTAWILIPEDEIDMFVARVEEITGDMDKHTGVMVLALDVMFIKGSMESV